MMDVDSPLCPCCGNPKDPSAEARRLKALPYAEYLQTDHWADVRDAALTRAEYRCSVCNARGPALQVHHRTYDRRGCERDADVIALCRGCHERFHDVMPKAEADPFHAIPPQRRIKAALQQRGALSVAEIAEHTGLGIEKVNTELPKMEAQRAVGRTTDGRWGMTALPHRIAVQS